MWGDGTWARCRHPGCARGFQSGTDDRLIGNEARCGRCGSSNVWTRQWIVDLDTVPTTRGQAG
ncbi:MAG: hypothetical protein JWP02_2006 [Acidimicrobiales bacterium]|nr:hypothetical protein [Acidimicrobiales bacterium]